MGKGYEFDFPPEYVVHDVCRAECRTGRPNGKGELQVRCPVYPKKWVEINVAKGTWNCFRNCTCCPGGAKGGILDFYMLFFNCTSRAEAYKQIMDSMGKNHQAVERRQAEAVKPKQVVEVANPEVRDDTYRALLQMLPLSKAHLADLKKRGFSDEDINAMGFKSIPQNGINSIAKKLYKDGHEIKGVPGFYFEKSNPKINCFGSGYFIPYRNKEGQIIALQVRRDVEIKDTMTEEEKSAAKKRRYSWFTSSNKDGGCSAANVPFYGIPGRTHKPGVVYATEGGLKAAAAQSLSNGWFTAIPGVNCFTAWEELLKYYKTVGITKLVDAFDSDRATNIHVAENIEKLYAIAKEHGFEMVHWDWGTEQKGVDDYLLSRKKRKESKNSAPLKADNIPLPHEVQETANSDKVEVPAVVAPAPAAQIPVPTPVTPPVAPVQPVAKIDVPVTPDINPVAPVIPDAVSTVGQENEMAIPLPCIHEC